MLFPLLSGVMHEDLHLFLDTNLPESSKKRKKIQLGVADSKIGAAIQEALGASCQSGGVVNEILRGKIPPLSLCFC